MTAMTEARATGTTQVTVPDIGDFKDVPIIEILVKEGDALNADDPVVTLESDKATMEVPSPSSGTVEKVLVKVGDKVSEGTPILMFKDEEGAVAQPRSLGNQQTDEPEFTPEEVAEATMFEQALVELQETTRQAADRAEAGVARLKKKRAETRAAMEKLEKWR
jgi:pyruvate dehydrogenase E2 component (dihydrolipoamide acetyltransferase)